MSKKSNVGSATQSMGWGYGYVTSSETPDRLFGRIFNVVEALGLSNKQEESLRQLIRSEIWNVFEDAIFISSERHSEIRELYFKKRREHDNSTPMSAI